MRTMPVLILVALNEMEWLLTFDCVGALPVECSCR